MTHTAPAKRNTQPPTTPAKGRGRPRKAAHSIGKKPEQPAFADSFIVNLKHMPDNTILRDWAVAHMLCCSRSTVWRFSRTGKLPAPIKTGDHMTGWRKGDIDAYLAARNPAQPGERITALQQSKAAKRTEQAKPKPAAKPPKSTQATRSKAAGAKTGTTQKRRTKPSEVRA